MGLFAAGVAAALASGCTIALIQRAQSAIRERSALAGAGKEAQPEPEPVQEVSLEELLAQTGWRINPDERARRQARNIIPLGLLLIVALLLFFAGSSSGWLCIGLVVGFLCWWAIVRYFRGQSGPTEK
jgi:hypothetical protein